MSFREYTRDHVYLERVRFLPREPKMSLKGRDLLFEPQKHQMLRDRENGSPYLRFVANFLSLFARTSANHHPSSVVRARRIETAVDPL